MYPPRNVTSVFLKDNAGKYGLSQPQPLKTMPNGSVVKVENGQVKVFTSSGSGLYSFGVGGGSSAAVSAIIVGDEIHVTRVDGKIVVTNHSGSQKRII